MPRAVHTQSSVGTFKYLVLSESFNGGIAHNVVGCVLGSCPGCAVVIGVVVFAEYAELIAVYCSRAFITNAVEDTVCGRGLGELVVHVSAIDAELGVLACNQ